MNSWVEIDTGKLASNIRALRDALGGSTEIIFVVKANAYGHGEDAVVRCAWDSGVRSFAVAHIFEAESIRKILPAATIIIVGAIAPYQAKKCVDGGFIPVITSLSHARNIVKELSGSAQVMGCHAKIDTGMGRLGIAWEEAVPVIKEIVSEEKICLKGICTHFASSDGGSRSFFDAQRTRFAQVLRDLEHAGIDYGFRHASNSAATVLEPGTDFDGVRPGIMLYGYGRSEGARSLKMQPILQWKTRVVQVKPVPAGFAVSYDSTYVAEHDTRIAVVDVGYSDGYQRALSNKGFVLIGGRRMPVAGRVTMNLIMVDAGLDTPVKEGDEVVLLGEQGEAAIWADELAEMAGTVSYEILTGIRAGKIKVLK